MSSKASTVGYVSASRSKNSRQAANRSCRSPVAPVAEAEQLRQPRLDEAPLLGVEEMLLQRRLQLAARRPADPRPRRSGSASAPCPPAPSRSRPPRRRGSGPGASRPSARSRRSTCRTPRPAGTCRSRRSPSPRPAAPCPPPPQAWNRSLIWRNSRSRPTNGASSPSDFSAPPRARDDPQRSPQRRRPFLALQLERVPLLVDDRLLGRAARRLADEAPFPARPPTAPARPC